MDLFRSFAGSLRIKIICADPESFLSRLNQEDILLDGLNYTQALTVEADIHKGDYKRVKIIAQACGAQVEIIKKDGIYWSIRNVLNRPVLLFGLVLLICAVVYLPGRIFFVRVEGNQYIPDRKIIEQAQLCGVGFGVNRRTVRSENVKNALLQKIPELQWIGVNTSGCVAIISVQEKAQTNQSNNKLLTGTGVSSIVASCDGIIQEVSVKKGNPLCAPGQAVKAGQTLVSGYTDCGLSICATQAQAEIYALTYRNLHVISPVHYQKRGEITSYKKKIYLQLGKKLINLYNNSGISGTTCVKICKKNYLTLPGGFTLPIALITEAYYDYEVYNCKDANNQQPVWLADYAEHYLAEQMIAGQILKSNTNAATNEDCFTFIADYICREMIALVKQEEIIK